MVVNSDVYGCLFREVGVKKVFAVVGNQINEIVRAFDGQGLDIVTCRNELSATLMADAYYKETGCPGIVLCIPGPGFTNTISGMLEAYTTRSLVIIITITQPSQYRVTDYDTLFHGVRHSEVASDLCWNTFLIDNDYTSQAFLNDFVGALSSSAPKPFLVEFEQHYLEDSTLDMFSFVESYSILTQNIREALAHQKISSRKMGLFEAFTAARTPLLILGRQVSSSDLGARLESLCRKAGVPILLTTSGKGVIDENSPQYCGQLYEELAPELLAQADLVLAVGTRLTQVDTADWELLANLRDKTYLVTDLAVNPHVFLHRAQTFREHIQTFIDQFEDFFSRSSPLYQWHPVLEKHRERTPRSLRELAKLSDVTFVVDIHEQGYPAVEYLPVSSPRNFYFSGISCLLGYSIPVSVGLKLMDPDRKVLTFCGDAGFSLGMC